MKKIISLFIFISVLCSVIPSVMAEEAGVYEIHLSAEGSDLNDGSKANPVKTFERARNIYREKKQSDSNFKGEILVHGGIYRLTDTFSLDSEDNGLKIKAFGDGEVFVRGSKKLSKGLFKKTTDEEFLDKLPDVARGKIYEYDLSNILETVEKHPEYKGLSGGTAYYELFVDGELQTIARWPNYGYALTGNSSGNTFESDSARLSKWKESEYGMVRGYWYYDWAMEHAYITDVDVENSKVSFEKELEFSNGIRSGKRYYAMNMPEEMDISGEYYIDPDERMLYYYPGDAFLNNEPELSIMKKELFAINGASDIEISGITFEYARASAISASNGRNITIDSCVVRNMGNRGILISTYDSIVKNCEVYNMGGGGISVSSGVKNTLTRGNTKITNNNVYNFGRTFRTYQSGIMVGGVGNEITFNTIHDTPHMGVTLGGNDNVVSYNEIYNIVFECSDSGGMYTGRNWTSWGNEVSYNYLHDIVKDNSLKDHTVSAVYLDDMMSGFVVKNNLFENCTQAVLMGGGRANTFADNIIVDCEKGIAYDDRAVTGNWAAGSVISGGTVYEGVMSFLENIDVDVWKEKYRGFSNMLADLEAYKNDPTHEMGYPEDAVITGNRHYGENVENDSYNNISEYVYRYGEVSGNILKKEKEEFEFPKTGAEVFVWDNDFTVYYPGENQEFDKGDIEFSWSRAGGADYYETVITDENGERVFYNKSLYNGLKTRILKKGSYNWKITAVSRGEQVVKEGRIIVRKDYYPSDKYFGGSDFENVTLSDLRDMGWSFDVASGDGISVKTDETGNSYLEMRRSEDNFYSGTSTYAKMSFPEKQTGKLTVTYDIMLENYRGAWRDMGSVQTREGGDVMRLLTHSQWVYGMGTDASRYHLNLYDKPAASYMTIKRVIDLDNDTYSIYIYQNGVKIENGVGSVNKACGKGDAENLIFRLGYQSPFEPCKGEGDALYRIDNISVDMGELVPADTVPRNDDYNIPVDSDIRVKWNTDAEKQTVNKETVSVYENGVKLENYTVIADKRCFEIEVENGLKYDSVYKVVISKNVKPDSLTHGEMSEDYGFSFATEKNTETTENDLRVIKTVPEKASENDSVEKIDIIFNYDVDEKSVNSKTVKVYQYSIPVGEYTLIVSGNVLTVRLKKPVGKGVECSIAVSAGVLPVNTWEVNPMKEDYWFDFVVKNEETEKLVSGYDFEDWDGFVLEGPVETSHKGWNFVLYEGDKVSVETDILTGSKALKLQKGSENSMMKVWLDYEVSGEELVKVRFDTYLENQSRRIHDWGSILNSDNKEFLKMVVYGTGYWHRQIGDTKRYLCGLGSAYATVEQILDYPGKEYTVNIYRDGLRKTRKSESANNKVIPSKLYFSVNNKQDDYKGNAEGDGVYRIDNVFIYEVYTPKVESITTDYIDTARIKFNRNIEPETVTKTNIRVYENEILAGYSLEVENNNEVVITFDKGMTAKNKYRFEIDGIVSESGVEMLEEYSKDVECIEKFEVVSQENDGVNTIIEIKTNLEKFICIAVKKGEKGNLLSCKIIDGKNRIIYPYDENTGYLFWESLNTMRPLCKG